MKMKYSPTAALAALLLAFVSGAIGSILQSAGDFVILGGTAITSSGAVGTVIENGNVGLSPAATTNITGFPPAVIQNGAIIATGTVTAQARQDLIKAQAGIAAMPSNANISNVDLGGQTLIPGVYTFNANANLTGTLILDGQGKNNAFWVFQIGTALTTAINAEVTIITTPAPMAAAITAFSGTVARPSMSAPTTRSPAFISRAPASSSAVTAPAGAGPSRWLVLLSTTTRLTP